MDTATSTNIWYYQQLGRILREGPLIALPEISTTLPMKRHEFQTADNSDDDTFVFFKAEGVEDFPFVRRNGTEYHFSYTNYNFRTAMLFAEKGVTVHKEFDATGEECSKFFKEALERHKAPIDKKLFS